MVKKGILIGTAVMVLLGLLFGREGASHVKTSLGWVRQSVRETVPVEFEISRARQMIKDLDPEIHRNMHLIAKEEVEVKHLREQLEWDVVGLGDLAGARGATAVGTGRQMFHGDQRVVGFL